MQRSAMRAERWRSKVGLETNSIRNLEKSKEKTVEMEILPLSLTGFCSSGQWRDEEATEMLQFPLRTKSCDNTTWMSENHGRHLRLSTLPLFCSMFLFHSCHWCSRASGRSRAEKHSDLQAWSSSFRLYLLSSAGRAQLGFSGSLAPVLVGATPRRGASGMRGIPIGFGFGWVMFSNIPLLEIPFSICLASTFSCCC